MTAFVESFATQQLLPPWHANRAQIRSFVIRLTEKRVAEYLAKYFNGAYPDQAPYHYAPLPGAQFGLVTASFFPNIASEVRVPWSHPISGGSAWDRIRHTEVYLAFPVARFAMNEDRLLVGEPSVVWVQPVVYSDNDTIVFSSREIWGNDMFLATIAQEDGLAPGQFHLDVGMIGTKIFNPRSTEQLLALLHIHATEQPGLQLPAILKANRELRPLVQRLGASGVFAGGRPPPGVKQTGPATGVELNNLKQFRDCYDMGAAIYRAIVASQTTYTEVDNLVFFDPARTEISFMWSDTLAEFLETIVDAKKPHGTGAPAAHPGASRAPSLEQMDWAMDRVAVEAVMGFSFEADVEFRVLATLHTYGEIIPAAPLTPARAGAPPP